MESGQIVYMSCYSNQKPFDQINLIKGFLILKREIKHIVVYFHWKLINTRPIVIKKAPTT